MIIYDGITNINKDVSMIKFMNSSGSCVEIPVSRAVAELISLHLNKISKENRHNTEGDGS